MANADRAGFPSSPAIAGALRFVGFFNRFRIDHPGVEITLTEAAPATLTEQLQAGELDVAILAQPNPFDDRLRVEPLYRERFVVACAVGHEFARRNRIGMGDMDGQTYLLRINGAFRDHLSEHTAACGARVNRVFRSEREDWIQTMVAAGMGVCFIPEFSATHPGIVLRRVEPEVTREVSLVTVAGRRWSTPMASFVQAIRRYGWPTEQDADIAARLAPPGASALRMA